MRPLIGIPTATMTPRDPSRPHGYYCYDGYPQAVAASGGTPVLVPLLDDVSALGEIYRRLDGLLLTGGADVDPAIYGESSHPQLGPGDKAKDRVEMRLIHWALEDDLPLLAICRGQQVLNVALGGTLYQDIASQVPGSLSHHPPGQSRDFIAHSIDVEPASRLDSILQCRSLGVNSLHHQAIRDLAPGLVITARASDGIVEAVESPAHRFVVAVQFHPEELYRADERMRRLFSSLVQACTAETQRG